MRRLFMAALGFALGAALCAYLLTGWNRLLALVLLLAIGCIGVCFRKKIIFHRAACVLLAAAAAVCITSAYDAFYLSPMEEAAATQSEYQAQVMSESILYPSGWKSVELHVPLAGRTTKARVFYRSDEDYLPGDLLRFSGTLSWNGRPETLEDWYEPSRGIRLSGWLPQDVSCTRPDALPLRFFPAYAAMQLRRTIRTLMHGEEAELLCALLTGQRSGLSYLLRDQMATAGIYHTLAVSGLHVSVLIGLLRQLLRRRKRLLVVLGLPLLAFYVLLTGASPSAVRAAWMLALVLIAPVLRREADALTSLGLAALIILIQNPYTIASVSFQLSFLACLGILTLQAPIGRFLMPKWQIRKGMPWPRRQGIRIARAAAQILIVTLSAQFAVLPASCWYFGYVSLVGPLSNLLCSFSVTILFSVGLLMSLLGSVFLPLGLPLAFLSTWLARYLIVITRLMSAIPYAKLYTASPYTIFFLIFLYALAACILFVGAPRRPLVPVLCIALMLSACLGLNALSYDAAAFTFFALDVGQGQCLLLSSGGVSAMIDCGGSNDLETARTAEKYLSMIGARQLDLLILTHYDSDHAGGVIPLMERIPVRQIIGPDVEDDMGNRQRIEEALSGTNTSLQLLDHRVARVDFGNGQLRVFPPVAYTSDNEACLTILASFDQYDILATGDISIYAEQILLKRYDLPDIELLVAGHHGSRYATSEELLSETKPELVVISVGENRYGHPAKETLERIDASGATVLRTDQAGTITVRR